MITSAQKLLMARAGVPVDRAWDLDFATYNGVSFSVGTQETLPRGVQFKSDGSKMYVVGFNSDNINEYDLSTPWDISSASFLQSKSVSAQESTPTTFYMKGDGLTLFLGNYGPLGSSGIFEYSMSTAWDISTLTYVGGVILSEIPELQQLYFSEDGLKFYATGFVNFSSSDNGDAIYQYTLSTAWDISTASYDGLFTVKSQDIVPQGIAIDPTGETLFLVGFNSGNVFQYQISSSFDVLTASLSKSFSLSGSQTAGIFVRPEGDRFYVVADGNNTIYQYSTQPFEASDPYFANVSLLLHGDGTDGSTTITDSSSNGLTVTANGNAQIDTTTVKYGTGAMEFNAVGDYLSIASNSALTLGSDDFTVEFWIYLNTLSSDDTPISQGTSASSDNWQLAFLSGKIYFFYSGLSATSGTTTFSTGQWYHIAMVGDGSSIKIYVDGVLDLNQSISYNYGSYVTRIGINRGSTQNIDGFIDDLRITKGVARYTTNFTPPTGAFPNQ